MRGQPWLDRGISTPAEIEDFSLNLIAGLKPQRAGNDERTLSRLGSDLAERARFPSRASCAHLRRNEQVRQSAQLIDFDYNLVSGS